jgi:hypothetical protein
LNSFFGGKSGSRNEFDKREVETSETVNRYSLDAANFFSQRHSLRIKFADRKSEKILGCPR